MIPTTFTRYVVRNLLRSPIQLYPTVGGGGGGGGGSRVFTSQIHHRSLPHLNKLFSYSSFIGTSTAMISAACCLVQQQNKNHTTLCEDNNNIFEKLFPKKKDGTTDWEQTANQLSNSDFWSTIATQVGSKMQGAIDSGVPTQVSYGFVSGYCSGIALKKAGKVVAVVIGLGFMTLQSLSYCGYVNVDHNKMQKDFNKLLDLNNDGQIDKKDADISTQKLLKILQYNMPSGSGFVAGFIGGIRSG